LAKVDPTTPARLLPGMLNDPSTDAAHAWPVLLEAEKADKDAKTPPTARR